MSISSSLQASVSGLNANASRLASISDNIANGSTYGYKRSLTDFHSMVSDSAVPGKYSAGGVRTSVQRVIDQQGQIVGTNNATDIAVSGRGFLPATTSAAVAADTGNLPFFMMTTGSFRPDVDGVLTSTSGMVLMGWPADPDGTIPQMRRDTADGLEPVRVDHNQFVASRTENVKLGVNLPATATRAGETGEPYDLSVEYFDSLGTSQTLELTFEPVVPGTGASNQWTMTVSDGAADGAVVGEYVLEFDTSPGNGGALLSVTAVTGAPYDPATGTLPLTVDGGPLAVEIGQIGEGDGLTQLDSPFAPIDLTKDGSPVGNLLSVEIDETGVLNALYDNGYVRPIYQIPLVDVRNPNGLLVGDNQTYSISRDSGPLFLWDAGDGPVGTTVGFAREASTVDIAQELTQLIQTQRAYSSNAKVIQTVDEMLQETTNIKR